MIENLEIRFHRGDKVKNILEGWIGTIVGYYIPTDGMIMYDCAITKPKDASSYEGETTTIATDDVSLELVEACDKDNSFYAEFNTDIEFNIGDKVKCIVSNSFEGYVAGIRCYMNNCIHYSIAIDKLNDKGKMVYLSLPPSFIEKISDTKIKDANKLKKTGGPSFILDPSEREFI